jgi:hypothetical protein
VPVDVAAQSGSYRHVPSIPQRPILRAGAVAASVLRAARERAGVSAEARRYDARAR